METEYVRQELVIPGSIEKREYQINILETAKQKNTLCVLPTGMGKTNLAIMLAAYRLEQFSDSKILIVAPTRPLCEQHEKSFKSCLDMGKNEILLVTGKIPPQNRKEYYKQGKIISATPQTIENDLVKGILNLENFSLLVVDEVHRAVKKYAYPFVSKKYMEQSKFPRILGLTASPGSSEEKIKEICKNLFADAVEIRTEKDEDMKPFIQEINIENLKVELTDDMKKIQSSLKYALKERLEKLKKCHLHIYTKGDLILHQKRIQGLLLREKRPIFFIQISLIAETVKVWHALELLETQSISSLKIYFDKLSKKFDKSSERILNDLRVKNAIDITNSLSEKGIEHPKIEKLKEVISAELKANKNLKLIIFSHFRDNIDEIIKQIKGIDGCRPVILIGQSGEKGLNQKQQIDIIKDYEADVYNCLITSPIGEEGLHLSSADMAIFYEPVSSEIRTIQRKGRVGRIKLGKIIFLIAKGTRDETNFYISTRKEKKMKEILKGMQEVNEQKSVGDFI